MGQSGICLLDALTMTNGLSASPNNGGCAMMVSIYFLLAAVVFAVGWSVVILWVDHVWGDAIDDFVDRHGWF
jgi:hypothetical protein